LDLEPRRDRGDGARRAQDALFDGSRTIRKGVDTSIPPTVRFREMVIEPREKKGYLALT